MSGHSKWHSIKHKKGAVDARRGQLFTKLAKNITIAAKTGGNPDMNPTLRIAIDKAKDNNVPQANIVRAIKRGTGELKDTATIEAVAYEGYGPGGAAIFIQCLTDNRNRTAPAIRHILSKHGGSLGGSGCVAWMFNRRGVITVAGRTTDSSKKADMDKLSLEAIDAGAEDVEIGADELIVYTKASDMAKIQAELIKRGIKVLRGELLWVPKETAKIEDAAIAKKLLELIEELEDDEDVDEVASNFDIVDEILSVVMEK